MQYCGWVVWGVCSIVFCTACFALLLLLLLCCSTSALRNLTAGSGNECWTYTCGTLKVVPSSSTGQPRDSGNPIIAVVSCSFISDNHCPLLDSPVAVILTHPCQLFSQALNTLPAAAAVSLQAGRRHKRYKKSRGRLLGLKGLVPLHSADTAKLRKLGYKRRWWFVQKA
jgi:hypothetical protein